MVVLTALGMAGAGVAAFLVESQRTEQRVSDAVADELAELEHVRADGLDPQTGRPFTSIKQLMIFMLASDAPDENEILVAWWDDGPQKQQSPDDLAERLTADTGFTDRVRELIATGGGTETMDTVLGEALVAVQPLRDDTREGALVVAYLSGAEREEVLGAARIYAVVSLLALLAVTLGAWSVAGRLLRPVRELTSTARDISDTDLSRRIPVEGDDDVSDLVRTVNAMLARLEDAFATQRTFLDDAGHELRTPVTVLRGHLELLDPYDHEDVSTTRLLLLGETDRMSRLVDDLIVLAKADRPDFVQLAPAEVGALTDQVLDKARATADRTWELDERAEGEVLLDPQRLTQALLQLAANAVRHTADGDVVAMGSRLDGRQLQMWVRDSGPGVAPEDRDRIFQRFLRGNGAPAGEGSGLGLSIVAAIAEAHGGQVHVDSPPGQGATFVLSLPVRRTDVRPNAEDGDA